MTLLFRNEQRKHKIDSRSLKGQIELVLKNLGHQDSELSILIVNDAKIRKLNAQYRNIDKPTDVLSFAQEDDGMENMAPHLLGDIVVSAETAKRQAKEHQLAFTEELALLIIHGILHLQGLDHERSPGEAREMRQKTYKQFQHLFPGRKPGGNCNY
jgi:probable rRNA maturation factor